MHRGSLASNTLDVSGMLKNAAAVATGDNHSCALTKTASVECWGNNGNGQLRDGTGGERHSPVDVCASGSGGGCPLLTGVTAIAAGQNHTCALMRQPALPSAALDLL